MIVFKLDEAMQRRGITAYELAKAMPGPSKTNRAALYRGKLHKLDLKVLSRILTGFRKLGHDVEVSELLQEDL